MRWAFCWAQAQAQVILNDAGDSVIQILNLPVADEDANVTVYNVDFVDATAEELYGPDLVSDFPDEADLGLALIAVNDALNEASTIPLFAGPLGSARFLIGETEEDGLMAGLGSENRTGSLWDNCQGEGTPRCIVGAVAVQRNNTFTWADFTEAGDAPPPEQVTIGGTVYGLDEDEGDVLLLANNDTDYLFKSENGPYVFEDKLIPGDSYNVSVPFISSEETCIVINGSGEVPPQNVTNVLVACGPAVEVTIGGTVDGLESDSGLVLQNNGADDKPIAADGPFTFDTPLLAGSTYSVTVLTNPTNPAQDCFVSGGSGAVPFQDVTNVAVTCAPPDEGPPPPDSNTVCEREECLADPDKLAQCNEMLEECLATAEDQFDVEQCVGAALLTCGLF